MLESDYHKSKGNQSVAGARPTAAAGPNVAHAPFGAPAQAKNATCVATRKDGDRCLNVPTNGNARCFGHRTGKKAESHG